MMFIVHGWKYSLVYIRAAMFLLKDGTGNYADDNIPYSTGDDLNNIIIDIEQESNYFIKIVYCNYLKANLDKYHVLLSEKSDTQVTVENV